MSIAICLFHNDFRLGDNRCLAAAIAAGHAIIPLYIHDTEEAETVAPGGASRWWLHHSLAGLDRALRAHGSRLVLRAGDARAILPALVAETGAVAIHTAIRHTPGTRKRMEEYRAAIPAPITEHENSLLLSPGTVLGKSTGRPLGVFTQFKNNLLERYAGDIPAPLPAPGKIPAPAKMPASTPLEDLNLLPRKPDWSGGIAAAWQPGEEAAGAAFEGFLHRHINAYKTARDCPSHQGTSRLSPHLHFGEISPRMIYHRICNTMEKTDAADCFLSEIIWREFGYELLHQFPSLPTRPFREKFAAFPWRKPKDYADDLVAWQHGRTGFPLVDAGMRELTTDGFMHNRVRMITASFLTKHLLIPWQEGEAWFRDRLVDADIASNSANWQWVAGCGADAAPYFRIFNPITQGSKFGAEDYVRRRVPEVAERMQAVLFEPTGNAIISHAAGRQRALDAFAAIK